VSLYTRVARPLLFRVPPEAAHHLAHPVLRSARLCRTLAGGAEDDPRLAVRLGDFTVRTPVGLAPGFDKYGELTAGMSRLGFGYLVPGTIMADPQGDAPRPRLARIPDERALINCMGLPSRGADYSAGRIERNGSAVPLIVSIGARDVAGFLRAHARLEPLAAAIELNVQCHNEESGTFDDLARFEELIEAVASQKSKPLFLKVNAYHGEAEREARMEMVARAADLGVDGFSAVGTFVTRRDERMSLGEGVVTGAPLREHTIRAIGAIREATGGRSIIRARGGIATGADAFRAIAAGASTVEVFTSFVYEGWGIASRINAELLAELEREGIPTVEALRGRDAGAQTAPLSAAGG
jgi:dihydroorotate dehydrogenase